MIVYDDYLTTTVADSFNPPKLGNPVHFRFESFIFNGLLQNWVREEDTNGNRIKVTMVDPRSILEATDVILNNYDEAIDPLVSNLLNVYGYYESVGFGNSLVNDAGIPWFKIREAITVLTAAPINVYGKPLHYRGFSYGVIFDASTFPSLPDFYRVSGQPSINLMDMIKQVCSDASNDFIVKLRLIDGGFYIVIDCVSRYVQQITGKIDAFIDSIDDGTILNSRSGGIELRKEVTSAYLVGGNIEGIVEVSQSDSDTNPLLQTIWPYWGMDILGNLIMGYGIDGSHTITIDISYLGFNTLPSTTYSIDVDEMRCAAAGQKQWTDYMANVKPEISDALDLPSTINWASDKANSPLNLLRDGLPIVADNLFNNAARNQKAGHKANKKNNLDNEQARFYSVIRQYAEMYGQYFMVRLPDGDNVSIVKGKLESETNKLVLNYDVSDGGWIDSDVPPLSAPSTLAQIFKTNNGKYECMVRFDVPEDEEYDFSGVGRGDIVVQINGTGKVVTAWVRAQAEQIVFLNNSNLLDGRVVVRLSGPVYKLIDENNVPNQYGALALIAAKKMGKEDNDLDGFGNIVKKPLTAAQATIISRMATDAGKKIMDATIPEAVLPSIIAIPLVDNTNFYGPWISYGPQGKTEFEKNDELVPWNYNGISNMSVVGQALADAKVSRQQIVETGEITVVGTPALQLGDALMLNGPTVTDINVDIGKDGITTQYRMRTYTPEFGRMSKVFTDKFTRLTKVIADNKNKSVDILKNISKQSTLPTRTFNPVLLKPTVAKTEPPKGGHKFGNMPHTPHSAHPMLVGSTILEAGNLYRCSIGSQTFDESVSSLSADDTQQFRQTAMAGLDTIFRPFSTSPTASGIPHYEVPTSSEIGASELNPIAFGTIGNTTPSSDFSIIVNGQEPGSNYITKYEEFDSDNARLFGLRMPMIGVGWGYDTDDKPVPNSNPASPGSSFVDGYRNRADLWKAGPIDIRWHNEKKMWIAGSASDPESMGVVVQHSGTINSRPVYVIREATSYNSGTVVTTGGDDHIVFNIQEIGVSKHTIGVGSAVTLKRFNGQYYINEHVRTLIKRTT